MLIFDVLAPFDFAVLKFLNVTLAHSALDQFWLLVTQVHKNAWAQMIVFPALLIGLFYRLGWHAVKPLLMIALTLALTDAIGYRLIKKNVGRPRPFENAQIETWVRKVGKAHGSSFPSNHAANSFAVAGILSWYFARRAKYFVTFALLVALSRVALGVHYPTDVLAGMILGTVVAFFVKTLIISRVNWLRLPVAPPPSLYANRRNLEQSR